MIYTIGYWHFSPSDIKRILDDLSIDLLVDLRSNPGSRYKPQFNRARLASLFGQRYVWKGDELGGKPGPATERGMEWLVSCSKQGLILLLMCAEARPTKCHRFRDIGVRLLRSCDPPIDAVHLFLDGEQLCKVTTSQLLEGFLS